MEDLFTKLSLSNILVINLLYRNINKLNKCSLLENNILRIKVNPDVYLNLKINEESNYIDSYLLDLNNTLVTFKELDYYGIKYIKVNCLNSILEDIAILVNSNIKKIDK